MQKSSFCVFCLTVPKRRVQLVADKKVCGWRGNARTRGACTEPVEVLGAAPRVVCPCESRCISGMVGIIRKNPNRTSAFAKATADRTGLRLILLPPAAAAPPTAARLPAIALATAGRFGKTAKEPGGT